MERTEKRVRDDLLGAGPKTVDELRSIAGRLRVKYQHQLERKIQRAKQQEEGGEGAATKPAMVVPTIVPPPQIKGVMDKASNMAGGFFAKVKSTKFPTSFTTRNDGTSTTAAVPDAAAPTIVDLPPIDDTPAAAAPAPPPAAPSSGGSGDWVGTDMKSATDAISNFSIGDEDEDDADLLL